MANVLIEENTLKNIGDAIRAKTGKTDLILPSEMPTEIAEITGGGGSGDTSDLVKYVTFKSWDGTEELYKKPTISGDDCVDVVSKGFIEKPTKESTNTTNYTYNGWSLTSSGSADSNALKNITGDRVVYVSFEESVRYYTVNFYDDDGTALLKTMQTTYGSDLSSYVPVKDGYNFVGWNTSVSNVVSDMNVTAVWEVISNLITDDWATIASNISSGNIAKYKVGQKKVVTITHSDGTKEDITFTIVGKGCHNYSGGKTNFTFMADNLLSKSYIMNNGYKQNFKETYLYKTILTTMLGKLDSNLQTLIKDVTYLGKLRVPTSWDIYDTPIYEGVDKNNLARTTLSGAVQNYWTSACWGEASNQSIYYAIDTSGKVVDSYMSNTSQYVLLMFDI